MELEISPITPDMAKDFTDYFGKLDFSHQENWKGCYCQYYQADCNDTEWETRLPMENRVQAEDAIRHGRMKGYLAYAGDQCVGWCNANGLKAYRRLVNNANLKGYDEHTGCIICFVIHPDFRGQGVARQMMRAAVDGFQKEGFTRVLAMPFEWINHPDSQYRGSRKMYEEIGFNQVNQDSKNPILVLDL